MLKKTLGFFLVVIAFCSANILADQASIKDMKMSGDLENGSSYSIFASLAHYRKDNSCDMEDVEISYRPKKRVKQDCKIKAKTAIMDDSANKVELGQHAEISYSGIMLKGDNINLDVKKQSAMSIKKSKDSRYFLEMGKNKISFNNFDYDHKNEKLLMHGRVSATIDTGSFKL